LFQKYSNRNPKDNDGTKGKGTERSTATGTRKKTKGQQQEAEGQLVFPDSSWGQRNSRWNMAAKRKQYGLHVSAMHYICKLIQTRSIDEVIES
jgi:hypothetical protein